MAGPSPDEARPTASTFLSRSRFFVEWLLLPLAATFTVSGLSLSGATTRLDNAIDEFLIPFAGPPGHYRQVSATSVVEGAVPPGLGSPGPWSACSITPFGSAPRDDACDAPPVRSNSIGLGLAVAHTVVTRQDGVIDCQAGAGGAVPTLTLPLCEHGEALDARPVLP